MPRVVALPRSDTYDQPVTRNFCNCYKCRPPDITERNTGPVTGYGYWGTRDWKYQGRSLTRYGMELEMNMPDDRGWQIAGGYLGDTIAEVKPDTGTEITTHPMSLPWFMRHYPFSTMLPELRAVRCGGSPDTYGIHVHVSKAGFSSADHMYNWLSVIYTSPRQMTAIGGRSTQWHFAGSRNVLRSTRQRADYWWGQEELRVATHAAAKRAQVKKTGRSSQLFLRDTDKERLRAIERKQLGITEPYVAQGYSARQCPPTQGTAVHESRHTDTFEVRFPGGGSVIQRPQRVKAVVQLVAGTVEYARQLRDTSPSAHEWDQFKGWVSGRRRYADLAAVITERNL